MGYGELPARASMRGYWKLENVNDSSGNARTLTNQNSVLFNPGRFGKAADFGSSGTTKELTLTASPLSSSSVADITFSFWYKLNTTGSSNTQARFFELTHANSGVVGLFTWCVYTISGGNITINTLITLTGVNASLNLVMPVDSAWHHIVCVVSAGITTKIYHNGILTGTNTGSGTYAPCPAATWKFAIGAGRSVSTVQAWAMIDEFILEERVWSASEIRKYYSQSQGRLAAV